MEKHKDRMWYVTTDEMNDITAELAQLRAALAQACSERDRIFEELKAVAAKADAMEKIAADSQHQHADFVALRLALAQARERTDWRTCPECGKEWPHPTETSYITCWPCKFAQAQAERDAATEKARELQGAITALNNLCNMTVARAEQAENELKKDITDLLSKIGLLEWKLTRENRAGDDMARKLDGLVSERDAATRRAEQAEAVVARLRTLATEIENSAGINSAAYADMVRAALAGQEGGV